MAHVYISYASPDKEMAKELAIELRKREHKVTLDLDVLRLGQDWRAKMLYEIESCTVVVSLITENTLQKQFPWAEIGSARALRKALLPVIISPAPIHYLVQDLHCLQLPDRDMIKAAAEIHQAVAEKSEKSVFIVHGHDKGNKYELERFLKNLGLNPIILHEEDEMGKTVIEKFEHFAKDVVFAFVLLTPDDKGAAVSDPNSEKARARQNVILELGYFMAKLGRQRVVLLHKGELEFPSDVLGIISLSFTNDVSEVSEKIRQRLKGVGLL
jgi:predicted nucleotide-binding protein